MGSDVRVRTRHFSITSRRSEEGIRLCVHGEIDMSTAGRLNQAIAAALSTDASTVLVDLAATTFCDCTGVNALLAGRHAAIAEQVGYQVVNPTGISLRVLRLVGLETLLTTRSS